MTNTPLTIRRFSGAALNAHLDDLARLRIEVFRDFPYLYDGTMDYERRYLQTYAACPQAVVVIAFAGEEVVGASTGIPMAFEEPHFRQPLLAGGYDPARVFYCAESVLRSAWRGKGIGARFFDEREAHARALGGFDWYCFCAVRRPVDHPLRPPAYRPLNGFWHKRGYTQQPALTAVYSWKDVDQSQETSKILEFWLKSTASAAGDAPTP